MQTEINSPYQDKLKELFESAPSDRFVVMQQSLSPLQRCTDEKILNSIIDPTTGHPYPGIILEGEFASIDVLNNNNRYYTEENYLKFVELLKFEIHDEKGLYGESEHPKSYAIDGDNLSHKILDIWYDKSKKKVFGVIMLLNTPSGLRAQEIVKSGGQIAVSARGGGAEVKNPDGTITAQLKLISTFDIVYHPGFSSAVLNYVNLKNLNESKKQEIYDCSTLCIYETKLGKLDNLFESYKSSGNIENTFFEWLSNQNLKPLFESKQTPEEKAKNKKQQEILEKNKPANEDEVENSLGAAVDQELTENELMQQNFFNQVNKSQSKLKKNILDRAYYDNSVGFINNPDSTLLQNKKK